MDFFRAVGAFILKVMASDGFQIAMTVLTLGVGVKGYMQAKDMLAKGQDIMANKIAAGGKIPVIYGSRRVGAQIVYMDTAGNSSTHLYVVYALSVGECEEIMGETIELSGNSLRDSKQFRNGGYIGSDKISSGSGSLCTANQNSGSVDLTGGTFGTNPALGGYRYVMNLHHGAASQAADPMLRASIGSKWTTAHKLNGIAFIAASYIYDSKGQFRGVPQLTVQVKGKKVFDPRDNSTAWSSNPALCFLDLIQNNDYGKGLATSQINMATFSAAANKADTEVNSPYFNGSAKALTWSGSGGDNFIKVLGGSANVIWWQNKVGELMDIYDANGNGVIDGLEITALQRNEFFSENPEYIVFFNGTLGGNYSSQSGSSLIKSKRFHCNAYIDCNKTVMENSKELLSNMRGIFNYVDGKYELQIEDTGSSTFSINDNHIIADSGISVDYGNKDKKANKVVVEFFNANKRYEMDTATVYHEATTDSNDYTSDDGGEVLELKVEFPHTTSAYIAYNHAKTILVRSRHQTAIQFLGTPEMYKLNVGDITNLTYAPLGFSGKIFRVEALQLQPSGLVAVSMLEYFDVYTWTVPPQEAVEALANVPSAYAVKAPTSLAFTDTDDSNTSRPFLAWALPTDYPYYQWRVNVKDSSGNQQINRIVDVNNCDLNFLPVDANYVANITALNSVGVESSATALTFTVGDAPTGTPDIKNGAITNLKVNDLSAAKINTGELNLGTAAGMSVRQNKTGYSSNAAGFWLGNDGGTAKFNIGNSSSFLRWDGSALNIAGSIAATTGVIGGFTVGSNSLIAGSGTSRISLSTAAGIHLGNNTFGSAPFRVSLAGALVATNANISGAITASSLNVTNATITGTLDASVITLNGEPLSNLMSYSSSGSGSITLLEVANINGDFVVNGNFEATGSQPDLVIGKVYNVSNANDRTIQADARLVSGNGDGSFKIQSQAHNNATLTTKASFSYTAFGNTASLGTAGTLKINSGNALSLTLDTSQNATFTGEVTADAIQLPVQTPSSTTNKIYNVGGALYFNGSAVGGGDGDITAVVAGTNLTGGGTSGSVTLNLANAISISGTISSGAITTSGNLTASQSVLSIINNDIRLKTSGDETMLRAVANGAVELMHNNVTKLATNSGGVTVTGNITTTSDIIGGLFKVGNTTVLDGSRNLTNIGTIGSGAITASSSLTVNTDANSSLTIKDGGTNAIQMVAATGDELYIGGNNSYAIRFLNSSNDVVLDNGSKLGIGNASPTAKVTIDNSIATTYATTGYAATPSNSMLYLNNTHGGSNTASLINFRTGSGDGVIGFVEGGGTNDADFVIQTDGGSNGIERLRVLNNGDIGFGTSSPTSYGGANFEFSKTSTSQVGVRVTSSNSSGEIGVDTNGTYIQSATANKGIRFYTNNGSVLAGGFISNGAFQIGTTTVIDASRNITNVISVNSANGFLGNASGTTPSSCKLHLGAINSSGSSAIAQFGGFTRTVTPMIVHESAGSSNAVAVAYTSGDVDLYSNNEGAGANKSVRINALKIQTTTVIDGSRNLTNIGTIGASGNITTSGNLVGASNNTTEIGTYSSGAIKRIRMSQGGEIHFGDTTTSSFLGITEGAMNNFGDQDRMGIYYRNELKLYAGSNLLRHTFDISGNYTAVGNITAFSDERLKTNIQTLDPKLALKMRGVSFTKDEQQGSGVIAQEIEKIAPELVLTADDEIGTKSVAYGNLVGYLIETVKDQQKQIDELKELIGAA